MRNWYKDKIVDVNELDDDELREVVKQLLDHLNFHVWKDEEDEVVYIRSWKD